MVKPAKNRICSLLNIRYPIIQGGMVWCSGWKLASAVSNAGGLGLIGAGSMYPDVFEHHLRKCKLATDNPFGVNIPLMYPDTDLIVEMVLREKVPIVFTSAGSPARYTSLLRLEGVKVVHVIANQKFAAKAIDAGVDAIVAEGFEAGGHNGLEETTTFTLIPLIRQMTGMPLIAAGGVATGRQMLAALALGADAVQIGSLFAATDESSAHPAFKQKITEAGDGSTLLMMKKHVPVRLLKNDFSERIRLAEAQGATAEQLREMLGRGRAKKGMFEGDLQEGELEIGQAAALIHEIKPVAEVMQTLLTEFYNAQEDVGNMSF